MEPSSKEQSKPVQADENGTTSATPADNDWELTGLREADIKAEIPSLHLQGESIFLRNTETILYELTQAPVSGMGANLGIHRVEYKVDSSGPEPTISSRQRLLYKAERPSIGQFHDDGILGITSEGDCESFSQGATLVRGGKYRPFLGRLGSSWELVYTTRGQQNTITLKFTGKEKKMVWANEAGETVAAGPATDGGTETAYLRFEKHLEPRVVHMVVMAWCTVIWSVNRAKRESSNQKKYSLFAPNYAKPSASQEGNKEGNRKPFGVWVASKYL